MGLLAIRVQLSDVFRHLPLTPTCAGHMLVRRCYMRMQTTVVQSHAADADDPFLWQLLHFDRNNAVFCSTAVLMFSSLIGCEVFPLHVADAFICSSISAR
jgi:hypothetical protein